MDILIHSFSGVAVGTVVASFSKHGWKDRAKILTISGFGGALPDLDAISLWSGFDSTFGTFFNLDHSGKEIYSAKFWYSHHAFLHSIAAAFLMAALFGLFAWVIETKVFKSKPIRIGSWFNRNRLAILGFVLGYFLHLLEDMPTPASTWGGVNFFWPSPAYVGGTGDIWWWNNYDIFLIVVGIIIINLLLTIAKRFLRFNLRKLSIGVFVFGLSLALYQIKTRPYDFAYSGYTTQYAEFEKKSKEIQKEVLGEELFRMMERFDRRLPVYF